MSYVLWATEHDSVELSGRERAYGKLLIHRQTVAVLTGIDRDKLLGRLVNPKYLAKWPADDLAGARADWWTELGWWLGSSDDRHGLIVGGDVIGTREIELNTAIAQGNDTIKLLAWMHGLCESHGRIAPAQHEWLREAIEKGRRDNVLRGPGILGKRSWEGVLEFIDRHPEETIVWSYSLCDTFPYAGEENDDQVRGWGQALRELREASWPPAVGVDLEQGFTSGASAYDLAAEIGAEIASQ